MAVFRVVVVVMVIMVKIVYGLCVVTSLAAKALRRGANMPIEGGSASTQVHMILEEQGVACRSEHTVQLWGLLY